MRENKRNRCCTGYNTFSECSYEYTGIITRTRKWYQSKTHPTIPLWYFLGELHSWRLDSAWKLQWEIVHTILPTLTVPQPKLSSFNFFLQILYSALSLWSLNSSDLPLSFRFMYHKVFDIFSYSFLFQVLLSSFFHLLIFRPDTISWALKLITNFRRKLLVGLASS